jgi:hypothetical protein
MHEVDLFEDKGKTGSETTSKNKHSIDNSGFYKSVETQLKNPLKKYFSSRKPSKLDAGKMKRHMIKKLRETAQKWGEADPQPPPKGGWFFE